MELPKDFPFHLMFPTPYPEPPRVISSKPLVSDVSITSEMPSVELPRGGVGVLKNLVNPKVKFKPLRTNLPSSRQQQPNPIRTINNHNRIPTSKQQLQQSKPLQPKVSPHQPTTSIYPSEETLQEIRRKYGLIPTGDDGGYSSDEESVVEEEPKKNPPKKNTITSRTTAKASTTSSKATSIPNESDQNLIRVRMQQIQSDLKKQFEKLQLREEVAAATESVPKTISKPVSPQPSSNHNPRTSRKESTTSSSSKESSDPETSSSTTTTTSGISSSDISSVSNIESKESSSSLPCKCNKPEQDTSQRSSSSTGISSLPSSNSSLKNVNQQQQMMDYIKSQDRQLKQISAQIDELLRIHHQNPSLEEEDRHQTKPKRISKGPPKRTIETMTSFIQHHQHDTTDYKKLPNVPSKGAQATVDQKNQQPKTTKSRPKVIKVPSCSDYLDSSIEKARLDLQRSLQTSSSSSSSDEEVVETTNASRPREKPRSSHPATESNQDMYSNMIHTINSILVRNGSFESQDNTETIYRGDHDHDHSSSGDHSNGHRSSCSNTPDNTASDREELLGAFRSHHHRVYHQQHQTSSPKRVQRTMLTSKTSMTARTKTSKGLSPNTRVKKRLLHSEQSLYIQRLASKYEIEEEEEDDDGSSDDGQQEDLFQEYLLRGQRPKVNNDTQDILKRFDLDREYDLKVYCLSDHNTSIATRNYLEKYGLTHSPPSHKNHPLPQKKNPIQNHHHHQLGGGRRIGTLNRKLNPPRHETLMEEDEDEEDEEVHSLKVNSNKPRSGKEAPVSMKKSKVREVKSRPHSERINDDLPDSRYNKILDLDAIKSLPKLT